jgi:response regulator of citrate/malate metabolism
MDAKPISSVWIIDDDPLHVLVLNRLLTSRQLVQTIKFFSGAKPAIEALSDKKLIRENIPDLIFLDLIMPKGDGWDFLDFYKKNKNKLVHQPRIIVISSENDEHGQRTKQYPDVINFLSKPLDKKEFDETIDAFIDLEMKKD